MRTWQIFCRALSTKNVLDSQFHTQYQISFMQISFSEMKNIYHSKLAENHHIQNYNTGRNLHTFNTYICSFPTTTAVGRDQSKS